MNVLIVSNPHSGKGKSGIFAKNLKDEIIRRNHNAEIFVSQTIQSLYQYFGSIRIEDPNKFDACIFLGGDGTFGIAVDAMLKNKLNFPVAIFPLGTVNDFARHLKMKNNVKTCVDVVLSEKIKLCDVALVNNDYVVNVACGGYFTHGANTYSRTAKKLFGRLAYYGKGIFNIFHLVPQKLRFTVDDISFEAETIMYLILNSPSAGGFKKIGAQACIDDGFFDLCVIKKSNISKLVGTASRILRGKHLDDKNILYLKGKHFKVEVVGDKPNPKFVKSDMDGNVGPVLPLEINVLKQKLKIFYRD